MCSNGDGELDEFELSNGLADLGMSDEEINGVLFQLDADADGKVPPALTVVNTTHI